MCTFFTVNCPCTLSNQQFLCISDSVQCTEVTVNVVTSASPGENITTVSELNTVELTLLCLYSAQRIVAHCSVLYCYLYSGQFRMYHL